VPGLLEQLAKLERASLEGQFVQDAATGALGLAQGVEKSFKLSVHYNFSGMVLRFREFPPHRLGALVENASG